jgi:hypothetical protein
MSVIMVFLSRRFFGAMTIVARLRLALHCTQHESATYAPASESWNKNKYL